MKILIMLEGNNGKIRSSEDQVDYFNRELKITYIEM